jgi:ABC-type multidrug transport system permease subunit
VIDRLVTRPPDAATAVRTTVLKEARLLRRDPRVVVFLLVLPVFMLLFVGRTLGGATGFDQVHLAVVGQGADKLVAELQAAGFHAGVASDAAKPRAGWVGRSQAVVRVQSAQRVVIEVSEIDVSLGTRLAGAVELVERRAATGQPIDVHPLSRAASAYDISVPGMAIAFGFTVISLVGTAVARDVIWRTWFRTRATAANFTLILCSRFVVYAGLFMAAVTVVFTFGVFVLGAGPNAGADLIWRVGLVSLACGICAVGLGLCSATWARSIPGINQIAALLTFGQAAVGGAFSDLSVMPTWQRLVARATPSFWAVTELRSAMAGVHNAGMSIERIAVLFVMAGASVAYGVRRLSNSSLSYDY